MAANAPREIDTERLTLRVPTLLDFEESFAMWSDPTVTRHIGGKPSTREDMWSRLLRYVGHWELLGYGFWTVREKGTGRFVGEVGLMAFRRELVPPREASKEVGWALSPWAQGKGFATEAVRAALDWSGRYFGPERMVCIIDPGNQPSVKVANRCGFKELAGVSYKGEPTVLYERLP